MDQHKEYTLPEWEGMLAEFKRALANDLVSEDPSTSTLTKMLINICIRGILKTSPWLTEDEVNIRKNQMYDIVPE